MAFAKRCSMKNMMKSNVSKLILSTRNYNKHNLKIGIIIFVLWYFAACLVQTLIFFRWGENEIRFWKKKLNSFLFVVNSPSLTSTYRMIKQFEVEKFHSKETAMSPQQFREGNYTEKWFERIRNCKVWHKGQFMYCPVRNSPLQL